RVGTNNWLGYQPFFKAQQNGFWDTRNIAVVELGSATEVIRALSNKSIDAAALTLDEAITARTRNSDLQVVMITDFSYGGDALIAKPGLASLADLKGKTIALENTALGAIMLDAVLTSAGLSEADVRIKPLTFDQHINALENDDIDAVITFDPVRTRLLAQGYRDLFNSRAIPGTIVDVLVVSASIADRYPEQLRQIVAGFFKARRLIVGGDGPVIDAVSRRLHISSDAVIAGYQQLKMPDLQENKVLIAQCETGLRQTADRLLDIMQERRIINQNVSLDNLCNNRLIHEITL
ncbi:MAG: ABC transporter substrate-binding protein, partial [Ketobacteraceae bacterium]|nr:ABC transporter substrate-binding protein [Ketobacteraceae bacterium]